MSILSLFSKTARAQARFRNGEILTVYYTKAGVQTGGIIGPIHLNAGQVSSIFSKFVGRIDPYDITNTPVADVIKYRYL